jgi:hypothetical protein
MELENVHEIRFRLGSNFLSESFNRAFRSGSHGINSIIQIAIWSKYLSLYINITGAEQNQDIQAFENLSYLVLTLEQPI